MQNFDHWLETQFEEPPLPNGEFSTKVMQKIPSKRPWLWAIQTFIWLGGLAFFSRQPLNLDLQLSGLHVAGLICAVVLVMLTTSWFPGFSLNSHPIFPRASK